MGNEDRERVQGKHREPNQREKGDGSSPMVEREESKREGLREKKKETGNGLIFLL